MTGSERPFDEDDLLASLLGASDDASRLRALLAAAAAPSADGPQPGEAAALAAFRELVTESAGVPSLAHRRRARLAVAAASTVVMVLGGGAAAAAAGALPDSAQQVAKNVLGVVGVHVPGPSGGQHGHGTHPGDGTDTGDTPSGSPSPLPTPTQTPPAALPTHPSHPAHPTTPANPHATSHSTPPGNSAWGHSHRSPSPSTSSGATPTRPSSASRSTAPGHTKHTAAPAATAHQFTPVPRSSGVRNARAALSD